MSPSRIALVAGGGALVAAWLAAAATVPRQEAAVGEPPPVIPAAPDVSAPFPVAADLAADIERLQRLAEAPAPRMGARNPFSLAPPPPSPRPDTLAPAPRRAPPAASRGPRATGPAVELIGVATAEAEEGSARTGILATRGGEVLLVRAGDPVPGGYRVDAIEPTSVTLADGSGARHRLELP